MEKKEIYIAASKPFNVKIKLSLSQASVSIHLVVHGCRIRILSYTIVNYHRIFLASCWQSVTFLACPVRIV